MITGEHDYLQDLARRNVCAEHHSPLEVAWYGDKKTWVLRCGTCGYPDAITRQLSLTEEHLAGNQLPEPIKSNVEKSIRRRQMQERQDVIPFELEGVPYRDLGTGEIIKREMLTALTEYAYKYHLDPHRGHVCLMYGKSYITLDGYLFYARQSGLAYSLSSRPLTKPEEKQFKVGPTDHAWIAEITFIEDNSHFTGLGIVTYAEMTAKSDKKPDQLRSPVVASHPWQLAQKRAEWQALRRAFPIGELPEPGPEVTATQTEDWS